MKLLIIFSMIFLLIGCSKNVEMSQDMMDATPQYLEEIKLEDKNEDQIIAELQALQNIKQDLYRISTGDKFNIFVYDETDMNTKGIVVKPDGTISFKLIGEVFVEGLTVAEATALVEERLKEYIFTPKVSLIPYELTGSRVTVMGKVVHPGTYEIQSNMKVADALATAGGLSAGIFQNNTIELADLERSYLIRNNKILPVDFRALIREGDMLHNIPLIDGDYIYVPSSVNKEVYVMGEVNNPWHFLFKESMTLMQVITFAEGMTSNARNEVFVIRGGMNHPRVYKINIQKILKGEARDFPLEPNDIIYVPKSPIAQWNELLTLLMPSLEAIQGGWMINEMFQNINESNN